LDVPADKDMAAFNNNNGYTMTALETAVNASDPPSFKPFRPSQCRDLLAKRIITLHEAHAKVQTKAGSSSSPKETALDKNNFDQSTGQKNSSNSSIRKLEGEALKALDLPTSLPQKDGKPDTARWRCSRRRYNSLTFCPLVTSGHF
jgi:hypothetical protein